MVNFNQLPTKFRSGGFRFPREHGLSSIWVGAVGLGLGLSLYSSIDIIGLIIGLIFASSILISSDSLMTLIKRKSVEFEWMPPLLIVLSSIGLIIWRPKLELLLVLGVMGILSFGYLLVSIGSKKQTPTELLLGSVAMGFLATCIHFVTSYNITSNSFTVILAINWVFISVTVIHIQYVETLREKISIRNFLLSWILILVSIIVLISFQIVEFVIVIPIVEPTIFVLLQVYRKEKIKESKRNIKLIGLQLMFRLWMAVAMLIVLYLLIIP